MVNNSTVPIEKATVKVPVTNQEIKTVSIVPTILQLMDLAILRFGFSAFLSFAKVSLLDFLSKINRSVIIGVESKTFILST